MTKSGLDSEKEINSGFWWRMDLKRPGGQDGYRQTIYEMIIVVQVKEDGNLEQNVELETERSR